MEFRVRYKKLIDLIALFLIISAVTLIIKYYFKPFISMIVIFLIANPVYKLMLKLKVYNKIAGALSILLVNIGIVIFIVYLGSSIYELMLKLYEGNLHIIEDLIYSIRELFKGAGDTSLGKSVLSILNKEFIKTGALTTGEGIMAYFIGNICAFFLLTDLDKIIDLVKRLIPRDIIEKASYQKKNFKQMLWIEGVLVLISIIEIIIGFTILKVQKPILFGVICGILDILPYVGTIIVFIPIIIYNIIVKDYLIAFGLICLYILVQVVREVLEAKFLSDKLELHPLLVLLSIYIGVKLFGVFGIIVGPMYGILAKEVIYSRG
ncbi:AI-2E family transporter [Clostridium paraputrificum]|uniref:AI-2E family transporter n=1 Tax=Clostridium TaxID=1485 RepID=UPI003D348037